MDLDGKKYFEKNEKAEIMLEGMIVIIITLFILIWILAVGFIYYQRYITNIVANDTAVKIASTYNNPTSDIVMGYVTTEELQSRDLYRGFTAESKLKDINEERAKAYVKYMLDNTNFNGVVKNIDVQMELVEDSIFRKHIKITINCTYNTPFGDALNYFGMDTNSKYCVSASAECVDYAEYMSVINGEAILNSGEYTKNSGFVNSVVKVLNSFIKLYNRYK
jgi:hypothetical protein